MSNQQQPHPLERCETVSGEPILEGTTVRGPKYNKQLFGNTTTAGKEEYEVSALRLHNDKDPNLGIATERPEHRLIVYLKARGMSNQEIAQKTGYSYHWVCQIVRQPWFRERFVEETAAAGRDAVEDFLKGEVMECIETMVAIRDSSEKDAVRLAAANCILDRALGKPMQHTKTEVLTGNLDAHKEMDQLETELRNLRAQQTAFGLGGVSN